MNTQLTGRRIAALTGLLLTVFIASGGMGAPRLEIGADAEVTYDGLHRVRRSVLDMAWVRPDLDLTGYSRLILQTSGISYREVDEPGIRSTATEFPVTERQKERIQEIVREAFLDELSQLERYEITTEPGRDVLILRGGIIDIVSAVPPPRAGRVDVYLRSVGEATIVVELLDSMSGQVLARVADRRAADTAGMPIRVNPVTAWSEVRQVANYWARLLRRRLDEFTTM